MNARNRAGRKWRGAVLALALLAAGMAPDAAVQSGLAELARVRGEGGLIALDRQGRIGIACNTARMSRAWIAIDGSEGCAFEAE